MDISFMHTPSSVAPMPLTPFGEQPVTSVSSRPSPVPFNLPRSSVSVNVSARRAVPPVPLFAAVASKATEQAPAAALANKGRVRGRFAAPDRDDEKEAADEQPSAQHSFTVRVEDEKQHTTFEYTTAAVVEEEAPAQPHESSTAAAVAATQKLDTKKRKRDSSDMVDIDDDITHATPSPQLQPAQHSTSISPASITSTDDDDIPHSIKKLRIADDSPPATTPPAAAPRQSDSLTSLLNGVTMGWYSSLYNKMHGAPTAETIIQSGLDKMGLADEGGEEQRKEGKGSERLDEVKRHRSDRRDRQLKERQENVQRHEQGEGKGRTGVKHDRAPHRHRVTLESHAGPGQHIQVEQRHTGGTQPQPRQRHTTEEEKEDQPDAREERDDRERTRAGPKAQVKESAEEARRKRMMLGAERRKQGREHTLLEKRELQRKREEEATKEAEKREEEETRRREEEQRKKQAELLEQARAMQREREQKEEQERQRAAAEQQQRERAGQREREAQREREREREREKQEREQQQQQQRAADKENSQNHSRPSTTHTYETPRRSTRLSSMQNHSKPASTQPADDTISARLHARRLEKEERDRVQQEEKDERERVAPHIERSVRQRARGKDYVGLVREFAPQLLEGKGRVVGVEVRKVLRRCMALYHPDKWQTRSVRERVESEHVFAIIQRAYEECGS